MKTTKRSFLTSLVALLVLFSMFVGTTFAWFTDIATSEGNIIQAGQLDIRLVQRTWKDGAWTPWKDTDGNAIFDYDKWEPGYTTYAALAVENVGTLSAKITAKLSLNGKPTILGDVIQVYATSINSFNPDVRPDFTDGSWQSLGTITDILNGASAIMDEQIINPGIRRPIVIALHMDENAGNEYQGLDLGANFDITIMATQATYETDSFDDQYDADSEWPYVAIKYHVAQNIAQDIIVDATLTTAVTVGEAEDDIYAVIPAGVQLAEGAESLTLKVESMETPTVDLDLERGEVARSIDVHVDGVAEDNTVPMLITLKGLFSANMNYGNTKIVHIQDGTPVEMTQVETLAELDEHNEFYYDVNTGDVTMCVASFSEYVTVEDDTNPWKGNEDTTWYNDTDTEFTLETADELAGFGILVDNGNTFEGKTVKLGADINMGGTISFNPIGFGYDYAGYNTGSAAGKVFKGTFDGQGYTISNLYVNGWDIGISYSNSGGGLFASVCDATIKNLTMSNANIIMECVEQGVIAGLAQGTCTFDNINIYGCSVANYQRATGGVVGEVSPKYNADGTVDTTNSQTTTFSNINIDSTTVIGSLWGDFDAPVGGVIGARWDDNNVTEVKMTNVNVACRLDVYNDVTSAYEWYAYRRAGMLIGNTEQANGHTATADFLTCNNVTVYYGDWVNYHYCQFTNQDNTWANNYPWVRVEAGENCSAFSNPRYGQPVIGGNTIQDTQHTHEGTDEHLVELTFNQLYGGGQGVYGTEEHTGVSFGKYTITYVNYNNVFYVEYVNENETPTLLSETDLKKYIDTTDKHFDGWVDANGNTYAAGEAYNFTGNITIYPVWENEYFVRCIDTNNNLVYSELLTGVSESELTNIANTINATLVSIQNEVDSTGKVITVKWKKSDGTLIEPDVLITPDDLDVGADVILTATPVLSTGSIALDAIYDETTGEIIAYQVSTVTKDDTNVNVIIPEYVGTYPVTTVSDEAAAGFENLHSITIPTTVTTIGSNALASDWGYFDSGETITVYYAGSYDDWENKVSKSDGWSDGLGTGSRIFFLNGGESVDLTQGYYEYTKSGNGVWPAHSGSWSYTETVPESMVDNYYTECTCSVEGCTGNLRPDAGYWAAYVTTTTTEE